MGPDDVSPSLLNANTVIIRSPGICEEKTQVSICSFPHEMHSNSKDLGVYS